MPGLPFSGWELLLILAIALIVLGPGKLPDLGAAMGRTIREFRKAATDVQEAAALEPRAATATPTQPSRFSDDRRRDSDPAPEPATSPANEREPDPALPPSVESIPEGSRDHAAPVEPRGLSTPPAPSAEDVGPASPSAGRGHVGG